MQCTKNKDVDSISERRDKGECASVCVVEEKCRLERVQPLTNIVPSKINETPSTNLSLIWMPLLPCRTPLLIYDLVLKIHWDFCFFVDWKAWLKWKKLIHIFLHRNQANKFYKWNQFCRWQTARTTFTKPNKIENRTKTQLSHEKNDHFTIVLMIYAFQIPKTVFFSN